MSGGRVGVTIRPIAATDLPAVARLHEDVLTDEFLATCGRAFLRSYYRAWIDSPFAIALCAVDERGGLAGALLGSVEPTSHYRSMLRAGGVAIASRLVARALSHPRFGVELVRTRGKRYVRGLYRALRRAWSERRAGRRPPSPAPAPSGPAPSAPAPSSAAPSGPAPSSAAPSSPAPSSPSSSGAGVAAARAGQERIGEITHVMVDPALQGRGVGRLLVEDAVSEARAHGLDSLVLVTPPGSEARSFYGRLGWTEDGEVVSGSGEPFVRFRLSLR